MHRISKHIMSACSENTDIYGKHKWNGQVSVKCMSMCKA